MNITLPQLAWQGSRQLNIFLPDSWQVKVCNMAGYDCPAMKPAEIKQAIAHPIGMPPIRELARGQEEVVILFDDMSRVTRVAEIVPGILEELAGAGIPDSRIRFVAALGCHGAMNRLDFVRKLGEAVLARFPVYNHDPFDNCVDVGTTSYGTRVFINAEVMKCDLKIGIGSIVPHIMAGFGGGAKILMPGVASIETVDALHRLEARAGQEHPDQPVTGMGVYEGNPLRLNMEEAAIMAGLDMKIDCLVNTWGETVAVFAGSPREAYAAGVARAQSHYLTPGAADKDIVIANTFAKVNESEGGLITTIPAVSHQGGDIVLIGHAPEGHAVHYLMGPFGRFIGGQQRLQIKLPPQVNHLIIFNEYPDLASAGYFAEADRVTFLDKWDDVLGMLRELHGAEARVVVYPNAEIQCCA
jgi:nickel-dependent lactate racemase